jgi:phosphoribosyl-ATP pyrophosphohydrolase
MTEVVFTRTRLRTIDRSSCAARTQAASSIATRLSLAAAGTPPQDHQSPSLAPSAGAATSAELERLYQSLCEATETVNPRTFRLLHSGNRKIAQKLIEEAGEVAIEAVRHRTKSTIRESADLLYHLVVLWHRAGVKPGDVWLEMQSRAERFGLAEKLPKPPSD